MYLFVGMTGSLYGDTGFFMACHGCFCSRVVVVEVEHWGGGGGGGVHRFIRWVEKTELFLQKCVINMLTNAIIIGRGLLFVCTFFLLFSSSSSSSSFVVLTGTSHSKQYTGDCVQFVCVWGGGGGRIIKVHIFFKKQPKKSSGFFTLKFPRFFFLFFFSVKRRVRGEQVILKLDYSSDPVCPSHNASQDVARALEVVCFGRWPAEGGRAAEGNDYEHAASHVFTPAREIFPLTSASSVSPCWGEGAVLAAESQGRAGRKDRTLCGRCQ